MGDMASADPSDPFSTSLGFLFNCMRTVTEAAHACLRFIGRAVIEPIGCEVDWSAVCSLAGALPAQCYFWVCCSTFVVARHSGDIALFDVIGGNWTTQWHSFAK